MTEKTPLESARAVAAARWRQAQQAVSRHALKSDPALDLELLTRARQLNAWRGVTALAGSWLLPQVPEWMGEGQDTAVMALFAGLGAVSLCFALWWLVVDGRQWVRWSRARRDLSKGHYGSRPLALSLGLPSNASLALVEKDSEEWMKLGEWVKSDRQLAQVWESWNKANAPVRRYDMRILEEAVIALSYLREVKAAEKLGKTPVKEPARPSPSSEDPSA